MIPLLTPLLQTRELAPETEQIIKFVSDFYDVTEEDFYISKRGFLNEPRNVAIYLVRKLRRYTLSQIRKNFSINKYSSVSSIIGRVGGRIQKDIGLRKNIQEMTAIISKSQEQT